MTAQTRAPLGRTEWTDRELRAGMSRFATGVTVVTAVDEDGPIGFTCQSFQSVSLEPALVSISVMTSSTSYPRIRPTGRFCVNVLAASHSELSNRFARRGTDKWAHVDWTPAASGDPVLDGALLWVDCTIAREVEVGDHLVVIGAVTSFGTSPGEPLLFSQGSYRHLRPHERPVPAWHIYDD